MEKKLGPYLIEADLFEDELGQVCRARDVRSSQTIWLRIFSHDCMIEQKIQWNFMQLNNRLREMGLRGLWPVIEVIGDGKQVVAASPWIEGTTLADLIQKGPMDPEAARAVAAQLAEILEAAHRAGVTHGDLRPCNIMITKEGDVRLGGWGIHQVAAAFCMGQPHLLPAPPAYLSPEMAEGSGMTTSSDIYATGLLLYEMLAGHPAFHALSGTGYGVQHLIRTPLVDSLPGLDLGLREILLKSMAHHPANRFHSAGELTQALLNPVYSDATSSVRPESRPDWLIHTNDVPVEKEARSPYVQPGWIKWAAGVIIFIILTLIGLGGLWQMDRMKITEQANKTPEIIISPTTLPSRTLQPNLAKTEPAMIEATSVDIATPERSPLPEPTYTPTQTQESVFTPTAEPTATPAPQPSTYTVSYNESLNQDFLFILASEKGADLTLLLGLNNLTCDSRIKSNQMLVVPGAGAIPTPALSQLNLRGGGELDLLHILECARNVSAQAFSPDGKWFAEAEGNYVYLWETGTWIPAGRLKGHNGRVTSLTFSPDGKILASGAEDATIRLWKMGEGGEPQILRGHGSSITGLQFSPDQKTLASVSEDQSVRIWTMADGKLLKALSGMIALSAAFSPDGGSLAVGYSTAVRLFKTEDFSLVLTLATTSEARHLAFSPDGLLLAANGDIWQIQEKRHLYQLSASNDELAFSPDSQMLIAGHNTWRISNGRGQTPVINPVLTPDPNASLKDPVERVSLSADGTLLAMGSDDGVFFFGMKQPPAEKDRMATVVAEKETLFSLANAHQVTVKSLLAANELGCQNPAFAGQNLIIPPADQKMTGTHGQVNAESFAGMALLRQMDMTCTTLNHGITFSAEANALLSGSGIWNVQSGQLLVQSDYIPYNHDGTPDVSARLAVFSNLNETVAVRSLNTFQLWNSRSGLPLWKSPVHQGEITSLTFSEDGKWIASATGIDEKVIRIWNVDDGALLREIAGYPAADLQFSPDGQYLVSVSQDTVRVWNTADGKMKKSLSGIEGWARLSPDGNMLAYSMCQKKAWNGCTANLLVVYDIAKDDVAYTANGLSDLVEMVKFSPDGTLLAAISGRNIMLWKAADGNLLRWINESQVYQTLTFSPDSSILASITDGQKIQFWKTADGAALPLSINGEAVDFSSDGLIGVLYQQQISLWGVMP